MAKIKKPRNRKGTPPTIEEASNNLSPQTKSIGVRKDLNFKVDSEFKRRFKRFATDNDITMQALLIKAFEFYEENNEIAK